MHNGVLLSHYKEYVWISSSEVDETGVYYTEWSNPERKISVQYTSSVQFSHSVVSDCLRPHESQPASPPCPSPTPGVHSDSRPLRQWCHLAISSSIVPFSSCPQSLPASESFPIIIRNLVRGWFQWKLLFHMGPIFWSQCTQTLMPDVDSSSWQMLFWN